MSRTEENRKYLDKKKAQGLSRYNFILKSKEAYLIRQATRNLDIREKVFMAMEKAINGLASQRSDDERKADLLAKLHGSNSTAQYEQAGIGHG